MENVLKIIIIEPLNQNKMKEEIAVKDKPCPFCGSYLKYKKGQLTICNNCKAVR